MKNTTIKNLISVGALAILLVATNIVSAYEPYVPWKDPQDPPINSGYSQSYNELPTWTPTQTRINNGTAMFTPLPAIYEEPAKETPAKTTNTNTTKNTTVTRNTNKTNTTVAKNQANTAQVDSYPYDNSNQLTALSLNGSGGFMPSSVWQWLIVIFLILVIIIIARILGRKPDHHDAHAH